MSDVEQYRKPPKAWMSLHHKGNGEHLVGSTGKAWVGIDVAKMSLAVHVVIVDEGRDQGGSAGSGEQHYELSVSNDGNGWSQLHQFLKKRGLENVPVCLEATGIYSDEVALFLHQHQYVVSVVNPLQIKAYAQSQLRRQKTDLQDARVIADFCRRQSPSLWTPPSPMRMELRAMVRRLDDLQTTLTQEHNRLAVNRSPQVRSDLEAHIAFLETRIDTLKQQIQDHIDHDPDLKAQQALLNSIPGIGDLTSGRLLAELWDMTAFRSVEALVAFVGLDPSQFESGSSVKRKSKISRKGNARLRAWLYLPALQAKRWNPLMQPLVERLTQRGLTKKQITVAVMRKLLHLVYGILKSGQPFDPNYLVKTALAS